MVKGVATSIITVAVLMGSLLACGGTTQVVTPNPELEPTVEQQSTEIIEEASEEPNDAVDNKNQIQEASETSSEPTPADRIIILGEDFVLADVLAMGVVPIAATATLNDKFTGIERDTTGIQPLPSTEANLELLASLRPDLIIATQYIIDYVDQDLLNGIATTKIISGESWRERVISLGEILDAPSQADSLLADYDLAVSEARIELNADISISLATIYPGSTIAVWVDGPSNIPQTILDMGIELSPGIDDYPTARLGREFITNERIGDLSSPIIILSQSSTVEGEDESLRNIQSNSLWRNLPAVNSGKVFTINRLGYPGVEGRIRLISELVDVIME